MCVGCSASPIPVEYRRQNASDTSPTSYGEIETVGSTTRSGTGSGKGPFGDGDDDDDRPLPDQNTREKFDEVKEDVKDDFDEAKEGVKDDIQSATGDLEEDLGRLNVEVGYFLHSTCWHQAAYQASHVHCCYRS